MRTVNMKAVIGTLIVDNVRNYRTSNARLRESRQDTSIQPNEKAERCYVMQMDMASGALDVLNKIDPNNEEWLKTGWTH